MIFDYGIVRLFRMVLSSSQQWSWCARKECTTVYWGWSVLCYWHCTVQLHGLFSFAAVWLYLQVCWWGSGILFCGIYGHTLLRRQRWICGNMEGPPCISWMSDSYSKKNRWWGFDMELWKVIIPVPNIEIRWTWLHELVGILFQFHIMPIIHLGKLKLGIVIAHFKCYKVDFLKSNSRFCSTQVTHSINQINAYMHKY
jgi:hypothetical protein